MRVLFSWLKELVEINADIEQIAEKLTIAGFEVECIDDLSEKTKGVIVGFVTDICPHPEADRLNICSVDIGNNKNLQIVCGASNIKKNVHVPVAIVGTKISSNGMIIKLTEIRGVKSEGMICSLEELSIEKESDGIAILEEFNRGIPALGTNIDVFFNLDDSILELAITANRPDGMSMMGIAREISALIGSKIKPPQLSKLETKEFISKNISQIDINNGFKFALTEITDINQNVNTPSHINLRLTNYGIQSINCIVDITNYVMLEQGQPLHAYDADLIDKVTGKKATSQDFGIRKAKENEIFEGLDGIRYNLNNECTVITCCDQIIAIAGVLGGRNTSVSNKTSRIWLESAIFPPISIRKSSRAIGVRTESSSRFEKGLPYEITLNSANRAASILKDVTKSNNHKTYTCGSFVEIKNTINLRRKKINSILGPIISNNSILDQNKDNISDEPVLIEYVTDNRIISSLEAIGCNVQQINENWEVIPPASRRIDLCREIDLVEEIARLIGYDKFESKLPEPLEPGKLNNSQKAERTLIRYFTASGFQELITSTLVPQESNDPSLVAIANPLLMETSHLRNNIWKEHLNICKRNYKNGSESSWVFEIGYIFENLKSDIKDKKIISGAITGEPRFDRLTNNGKPSKIHYYEARGLLTKIFMALKLDVVDKPNTENKHLHPGRSADLFVEGQKFGYFGQIHPKILDDKDIQDNTFIFELNVENIIKAVTRKTKWTPIFKTYSTYPWSERDLSLIIDKEILSINIKNLINKVGKPLLVQTDLIDMYEGNNIDSKKCSQTYRLRYRSEKGTLKDEDINPIHEKIRSELIKKFDIELRS